MSILLSSVDESIDWFWFKSIDFRSFHKVCTKLIHSLVFTRAIETIDIPMQTNQFDFANFIGLIDPQRVFLKLHLPEVDFELMSKTRRHALLERTRLLTFFFHPFLVQWMISILINNTWHTHILWIQDLTMELIKMTKWSQMRFHPDHRKIVQSLTKK